MIKKIDELPQQQQIVLAVLVVAALGAIWYYVISPMGAEVDGLEGQKVQLVDAIATAQAAAARMPQLEQETAEREAALAELRQQLPDEKETADFVNQMEDMAVQSNLDIKTFSPLGAEDQGFYSNWPIRISLEGNYHNLGIFFDRVANFTRIVNVSDIDIRSLGSSSPEKTLAATCTATTFVFVEERGG